jgi:methionyl-tRNA formyltransferase
MKDVFEYSDVLDKMPKGAVLVILPEEESRRHSNYASFSDIRHQNNLQLIETKNINNNIDIIKDMDLDYLFVLGWSQIINKEIINTPAKGCIGNHPTLLPRDRGERRYDLLPKN